VIKLIGIVAKCAFVAKFLIFVAKNLRSNDVCMLIQAEELIRFYSRKFKIAVEMAFDDNPCQYVLCHLTMKATIIIPTYNEAENIEPICREIFNYLPEANIIIVDDDSRDNTPKIASLLAQNNNHVKFISRKGKTRSFAQSYIDGFKIALETDTDAIVQMDADFSHNPKHLPEMLEKLKNFDLVVGSRYTKGGQVENWSLWRKILSRGSNLYAKIIVGLPIADPTAGFISWKREALKKIDLNGIKTNGYAFLLEMKFYAQKNKLKMAEIPITFVDRKFGASKMSKKLIWESALFCWKLRLK